MATQTPQPNLSLMQKLDLFPGLLSVLFNATFTAITAPFRGESGAYTYKQHVMNSGLRTALLRFSTAQMQYVGGSFGSIYEGWCKKKGIEPEFVTLPSGCKAFWVGDKTAKHTVVYFHGGGFAMDGADMHLDFTSALSTDAKEAGKSIAFLCIEYTLVPHATYPGQLAQAVEAVNYVLHDLGKPPSQILLGGDSAGGNICVALLAHLSRPSPDLPEIRLSAPLKGVMVLAPWVSFRVDFDSCTKNRYKDVFFSENIKKWSDDYLAGKQSTPYAEPLLAPAEWWKDAKVEQVLVCAGSDEILAGGITEWVEKYKSVNPNTMTYVFAKNEVHIQPIIAPTVTSGRDTEQEKAFKSWIKAKL